MKGSLVDRKYYFGSPLSGKGLYFGKGSAGTMIPLRPATRRPSLGVLERRFPRPDHPGSRVSDGRVSDTITPFSRCEAKPRGELSPLWNPSPQSYCLQKFQVTRLSWLERVFVLRFPSGVFVVHVLYTHTPTTSLGVSWVPVPAFLDSTHLAGPDPPSDI